jgi:hypothetical protein
VMSGGVRATSCGRRVNRVLRATGGVLMRCTVTVPASTVTGLGCRGGAGQGFAVIAESKKTKRSRSDPGRGLGQAG